jgi:16S rRNA (uracil1498-N3)-methyltransferase
MLFSYFAHMNIFYCPGAVLNGYCELDETESRHVATVLRKREGDELFVFDGAGNLFNSRIKALGKREVTVQIISEVQSEESNHPKLHIAIAPPKNMERLEWFAEKVTEIGVAEITMLHCQHSERKEVRLDRIEKILLGACKQSLKLTLPKLNDMVKLSDFVKQYEKSGEGKFIAYCDEKSVHLKKAYTAGTHAIVMIGPEGDFTSEEVQVAQNSGFQSVSLGKSRLRLETAGIFAASIFNLVNES